MRIIGHGRPLVETEIEPPPVGPSDVLVAVEAAGICRSDVHYRSGTRKIRSLPLTPGHEVAGTIIAVGSDVSDRSVGERVAVHYLISCGVCEQCVVGREQFCTTGAMVGLDRDGGYAETITVPARNAYPIPDSVPTEVAAIMMCSSSTSLHALRRGRFREGESVAVIGCGGLGMSAIKIARALGARDVFAIDIDPQKLAIAEGYGAVPLTPDRVEGVQANVALELVGLPETMRTAVNALGVQGRAVAVGLADESFALHSFEDLILKETEVIGAMDHFGSEIDELFAMVVKGQLELSDMVTASVPLDAEAINEAMDRLEAFDGGVRTVIHPTSH